MKTRLTASAVLLVACATVTADPRPDSHAPISVMGDHIHKTGEVMFSYRYMHMSMNDNRKSTSRMSPEEIATTVPNRFAGSPMMPPTLRVVPTKMTMDMHMLGVMYAPTDRLTLMGMASYLKKDMTHITFAGPVGTTRLGNFKASTSGIGDTVLSAMYGLSDSVSAHRWHATLGVSLPTGSSDEEDRILTPMNTQPEVRVPYPMQLGSGTYDLVSGLTYASDRDVWGWGAQLGAVTRLGDNGENYTLGNEYHLKSWVSYLLSHSVSLSGSLGVFDRGNIDGIDAEIMAPVQTADPSLQGGQRVERGLGMNFLLPAQGHRVAFEAKVPVYQNLDGPQLEVDWSVVVGWQYTP
jgi:hypothetical protein